MSDYSDPAGEMVIRRWAQKIEKQKSEGEDAVSKLGELMKAVNSDGTTTKKALAKELKEILESERVSKFSGDEGGLFGGKGATSIPEHEKHTNVTGFEKLPWESDSDLSRRQAMAEQIKREFEIE